MLSCKRIADTANHVIVEIEPKWNVKCITEKFPISGKYVEIEPKWNVKINTSGDIEALESRRNRTKVEC